MVTLLFNLEKKTKEKWKKRNTIISYMFIHNEQFMQHRQVESNGSNLYGVE